MSKSKKKAKPTLEFGEFLMQDVQKEQRIKNIVSILLQDMFMFLERLSVVDNPEREKFETLSNQMVEERLYSEGLLNRSKDQLIRKLFILEEIRQYNNFLQKRGK
jgi:hypothetical protein